MILKKITTGYVVQSFDTNSQQFVSQEFISGDEVEYTTEDGLGINPQDFFDRVIGSATSYHPFDMVQP